MILKKHISPGTFRNSFWSVFDAGIYPVLLVVATPIFLNRLGTSQYGLWVLINSISMTLGMLNFGLPDSTIKFVSKYRGVGDYTSIHNLLRANLVVTLWSALLMLLVGVGIAWISNVYKWLDVEALPEARLSSLILIGAFVTGLKFMEQMLLAMFRGYERYDRAAQFSMASRLTIILLQITLVLLGFDLVMIFVSSVAVLLPITGIQLLLLHRMIPGFRFTGKLEWRVFKEEFNFGIWSWFTSLAYLLSVQLDKLIVVYFADLTVLAYYSFGTMVYNQLHSVFASGMGWLFPKISIKLARREKVASLFYNTRLIMICGGLILLSFLGLFGDWIFPFWLGDETYAQSRFFIFGFMAYEAFLLLSIVPGLFMMGAGEIKTNALVEIGARFLNMIGMVAFFSVFGIEGLVYGLLLSVALYIPIQYGFALKKVLSREKAIRPVDFLTIVPSVSMAVWLVWGSTWHSLIALPIVVVGILFLYLRPMRLQQNQINKEALEGETSLEN